MAKRKKDEPQVYKAPRRVSKPPSDNPSWLVPTIIALFVGGVLWIVTSYVTGAQYPVAIGNYNILVGFVFMVTGMVLLSRWK